MKTNLSIAVLALLGQISANDISRHQKTRFGRNVNVQLLDSAEDFDSRNLMEMNQETKQGQQGIQYMQSVAEIKQSYDAQNLMEQYTRLQEREDMDANPVIEPESSNLLQFNHENDDDDVGSDVAVMTRGSAQQRMVENDKQAIYLNNLRKDPQDMEDLQLIQLNKSHEDPVDETMNMIDAHQTYKEGSYEELMSRKTARQSLAEASMNSDAEEVQNLMDEQAAFVQLSSSHQPIDPTDETMNMIEDHRHFREGSFFDKIQKDGDTRSSEEKLLDDQNEDVRDLMAEQMKDVTQLQLNESDSDSSDSDEENFVMMPHENDTEDIAMEVNPLNGDHAHSKAWNEQVERKAKEMEEEEQILINMKKKAKQDKIDSAAKAAKNKAKKHQQHLMQLEKAQHKSITMNPSVDFGEMYSGMESTAVQLSSNDHEIDTDDIVPELDQHVVAVQKTEEYVQEDLDE